MPRALAVVWDLVRSELPDDVKKGTLLAFDRVLGLGLADWEPPREEVPAEVMEMVERRAEARLQRDFGTADALRAEILEAGFEVDDLPDGPRVSRRS